MKRTTKNKTTTQMGDTEMTHNWKRYAMVGMAMVTMVMANVACGGGGDDVTDVNIGDETANEIVDDVLETADDINDSTFMKLWDATSFDDDTDTDTETE